MKAGKEPSLDEALSLQTEIDLRIPALLPEDYIVEVNTRLSLYKKLAGCKSIEQINEFQIELIDRFGLLPQAAKNLIRIAELKLDAKQVGINKIDATVKGAVIEFHQDTKVEPGYIIRLIQTQSDKYKLEGPQKLKMVINDDSHTQRIERVASLLTDLKQQVRAA